MFRAGARAAIGLVATGCSPLVATVGVEGTDASQSAADGNVADAMKPVEEHDADSADANAVSVLDASPEQEAATMDAGPASSPSCVYMPDLAQPYVESEGGIRSIDTGVIVASTDEALGCTQAPVERAVYVTYMRTDGEPLMRDGIPYVIPAPAGTGGSLNTYLASRVCEQPFIPTFWFFLAPPIGGCNGVPGRAAIWRLLVPVPSPFPDGFMLCESSCP